MHHHRRTLFLSPWASLLIIHTPASHSGFFSHVSRPWHSWLSDLLRMSITLLRKFVGCTLKTSSTASFHIRYKSTNTEQKKNAGPNQRKVNPTRNVRKKYYMNTGHLKHDFRVLASWGLKKNVRSVHLEFPCRHGRRETSGTVSSTASDGGSLSLFRMKLPPRTVRKCGCAHSNSYMVHAWWCSTTFSSCISEFGAIDRTRWANIMACSFSRFMSLIIHLWGNLMTTAYATEVRDV
jgi:hypothetical protein